MYPYISEDLRKYLAVFKISAANVFQYRLNFLIGRARDLILLATLYYLWKTIFGPAQNLFGYTLAAMFTYVAGSHLARALVLLTNTTNIASEITGGGKFFAYLVRPVSYLKYWFTVDLAMKIIEFPFALLEIVIIAKFFKIDLIFQTNPLIILATIISVLLALILNFYLGYLVSLAAFWTPQAWGPRFLFDLLLSFSAGAFFPLDVFGKMAQTIFASLPFYYLLFFPINVYLGRIAPVNIFIGFIITLSWVVVIATITQFVWQAGLRAYEGGGI